MRKIVKSNFQAVVAVALINKMFRRKSINFIAPFDVNKNIFSLEWFRWDCAKKLEGKHWEDRILLFVNP